MHRFRRKGATSDLKKKQQMQLDYQQHTAYQSLQNDITEPDYYPTNYYNSQANTFLLNPLPSPENFRQSLILPHLSSRFSVLREPQTSPLRTTNNNNINNINHNNNDDYQNPTVPPSTPPKYIQITSTGIGDGQNGSLSHTPSSINDIKLSPSNKQIPTTSSPPSTLPISRRRENAFFSGHRECDPRTNPLRWSPSRSPSKSDDQDSETFSSPPLFNLKGNSPLQSLDEQDEEDLNDTTISELIDPMSQLTSSIQKRKSLTPSVNSKSSIRSVNSKTVSIHSSRSRDSHVAEIVPIHSPSTDTTRTFTSSILAPTANFLAINSSTTSLHSNTSAGSSFKDDYDIVDDHYEDDSDLIALANAVDPSPTFGSNDKFDHDHDQDQDQDQDQDFDNEFQKEDVIRIQRHIEKIQKHRIMEEQGLKNNHNSTESNSNFMRSINRAYAPAASKSINYDEAMSMDSLKINERDASLNHKGSNHDDNSHAISPRMHLSPSVDAYADDEGSVGYDLVSPWTLDQPRSPPTTPQYISNHKILPIPPTKPPPPPNSLEETLIAFGQGAEFITQAPHSTSHNQFHDYAYPTPPTPGVEFESRSRSNSAPSPPSSRGSHGMGVGTGMTHTPSKRKNSAKRIKPSDISTPQLVSTSSAINTMPIVHLDDGVPAENNKLSIRKSFSGRKIKTEFEELSSSASNFKSLLKRFSTKKTEKLKIPLQRVPISRVSSAENLRHKYDPKLAPVTLPVPAIEEGNDLRRRRRSKSVGSVIFNAKGIPEDIFSDPETYGSQDIPERSPEWGTSIGDDNSLLHFANMTMSSTQQHPSLPLPPPPIPKKHLQTQVIEEIQVVDTDALEEPRSRDNHDDLNRLRRMMKETMEGEKAILSSIGGSSTRGSSRSREESNSPRLSLETKPEMVNMSNPKLSIFNGGENTIGKAIGFVGSIQSISAPRGKLQNKEDFNNQKVFNKTIIIPKSGFTPPLPGGKKSPLTAGLISPQSPLSISSAEQATVQMAERVNRKPSIKKVIGVEKNDLNGNGKSTEHKREHSNESFKSLHSPTSPRKPRISRQYNDELESKIGKNSNLTIRTSSQLMVPNLPSPSSNSNRFSQKSVYSSYGESLYDSYLDDSSDAPDLPSPRPFRISTEIGIAPDSPNNSKHLMHLPLNSPKLGTKVPGQHVEVVELANGSVIWEVVNGLRDDNSRPGTSDRSSMAESLGKSRIATITKSKHTKNASNATMMTNGSSEYGGSMVDSLEDGERLVFPTLGEGEHENGIKLGQGHHIRHGSNSEIYGPKPSEVDKNKNNGLKTNVLISSDEKVRRFVNELRQQQERQQQKQKQLLEQLQPR